MSKSIIAAICVAVLFAGTQCAYGQVIEDDASLILLFEDTYFLEASLAQGQQKGGLVAFNIEDLGRGEYQISYEGIAQLIAAFDVEPAVVFNASYVANSVALAVNDNSVNNGIVNLAIGESFFLGYWDDSQYSSYEFTSAVVDSEDGFGWAEIRRNADGLELLGSATAESKGIIVGTAIQAEVVLGDVNLDGAVNLLDISPFVDVIQGGTYQCEADINQDGLVNLLDVGAMVNILSGG